VHELGGNGQRPVRQVDGGDDQIRDRAVITGQADRDRGDRLDAGRERRVAVIVMMVSSPRGASVAR
jgi:hypothetical protein